jgi:hypothetical protein
VALELEHLMQSLKCPAAGASWDMPPAGMNTIQFPRHSDPQTASTAHNDSKTRIRGSAESLAFFLTCLCELRETASKIQKVAELNIAISIREINPMLSVTLNLPASKPQGSCS